MEFLSSKKLRHVDGLSRSIIKFSKLLEDTMITAFRDEKELSVLICNTIWQLPVTLDDIKKKKTAKKDEFIKN